MVKEFTFKNIIQHMISKKVLPYVVLICIYLITYIIAMSIISYEEPLEVGTDDNLFSEEFELEQARGMIKHRYTPIDNPYEFNKDCYVLAEDMDSRYRRYSIEQGAEHMYEQIGIQYYHLDVNVTGVMDEEERLKIMEEYFKSAIDNPEYSIARVVGYSAFVDEETDESYFIIKNSRFMMGSEVEEFFDSEALYYLEELYDYYNCTWYDTLGSCVTDFCNTVLQYGVDEDRRNSAKIIATVIFAIASIATALYGFYRRYTEDTIRILDTTIEQLKDEAEELRSKYE